MREYGPNSSAEVAVGEADVICVDCQCFRPPHGAFTSSNVGASLRVWWKLAAHSVYDASYFTGIGESGDSMREGEPAKYGESPNAPCMHQIVFLTSILLSSLVQASRIHL